jgi:hypothetical protein
MPIEPLLENSISPSRNSRSIASGRTPSSWSTSRISPSTGMIQSPISGPASPQVLFVFLTLLPSFSIVSEPTAPQCRVGWSLLAGLVEPDSWVIIVAQKQSWMVCDPFVQSERGRWGYSFCKAGLGEVGGLECMWFAQQTRWVTEKTPAVLGSNAIRLQDGPSLKSQELPLTTGAPRPIRVSCPC